MSLWVLQVQLPGFYSAPPIFGPSRCKSRVARSGSKIIYFLEFDLFSWYFYYYNVCISRIWFSTWSSFFSLPVASMKSAAAWLAAVEPPAAKIHLLLFSWEMGVGYLSTMATLAHSNIYKNLIPLIWHLLYDSAIRSLSYAKFKLIANFLQNKDKKV